MCAGFSLVRVLLLILERSHDRNQGLIESSEVRCLHPALRLEGGGRL